MKDYILEILLKVVIVIGIIGIIGVFGTVALEMIIGLPVSEKTLFVIVYGSMGMTAFSAIMIIVFSFLGGEIKQKPIKAEKFKLSCDEFDELKVFLEKSLSQKEYALKKEVSSDEKSSVTVYARNNRVAWLECFSLIHVDEWTYEIEDLIDHELEKLVEEYCNEGTRYRKISMMIVICVNRITPVFQKLVNGNIQQGLNQFRLPVGISFGGKQIYIAKQKDGFAVMQYKKLRKEFLDIMGIVEK